MIKITNGASIVEVTTGAYESVYRKMGFKPVDQPATAPVVYEVKKLSDDEVFQSEIVLKPISSWKADEIKRFASLRNISLEGTKNASEAREIVKDYLEYEEASDAEQPE